MQEATILSLLFALVGSVFSVANISDQAIPPQEVEQYSQESQINKNAEQLAKCLTDKGVVMYGAEWCSFCQQQKEIFGEAFNFVTYQECDDSYSGGDSALCRAQNITSYPTWIIPGQENAIVGAKSLKELANLSNCPY